MAWCFSGCATRLRRIYSSRLENATGLAFCCYAGLQLCTHHLEAISHNHPHPSQELARNFCKTAWTGFALPEDAGSTTAPCEQNSWPLLDPAGRIVRLQRDCLRDSSANLVERSQPVVVLTELLGCSTAFVVAALEAEKRFSPWTADNADRSGIACDMMMLSVCWCVAETEKRFKSRHRCRDIGCLREYELAAGGGRLAHFHLFRRVQRSHSRPLAAPSFPDLPSTATASQICKRDATPQPVHICIATSQDLVCAGN